MDTLSAGMQELKDMVKGVLQNDNFFKQQPLHLDSIRSTSKGQTGKS